MAERLSLKIVDFEKEFRREELDFLDLSNDLQYVVNLNEQLANRYQSLMDCFPTPDELDKLIDAIKVNLVEYSNDDSERDRIKEVRLLKLRKFKTALVALDAQDHFRVNPKK